ncbi:MAG: hypothetical protein H0X51_09150 [Parachlamydiaceae bacterium]|nr:hypothetical protein [Parachlamydiaceae bacterium]
MDFTRQPIIETVITPKEGCKLVVRSSKSAGQEEYFVDALEVVAFGNAIFYRSLERPKSFLVPASDYEVLEVREARMVLKHVGSERTIKIGGGREPKPAKEPREAREPREPREPKEIVERAVESAPTNGDETAAAEGSEGRTDKKRDRRRHGRRRRGRDETSTEEGTEGKTEEGGQETNHEGMAARGISEAGIVPTNYVSNLLPPPTQLISETIARYKDNAQFKGAFYTKEELADRETEVGQEPVREEFGGSPNEDMIEAMEMQNASLEPSAYSTLGFIEEEQQEEETTENFPHISSEDVEPVDSPFFPHEDNK